MSEILQFRVPGSTFRVRAVLGSRFGFEVRVRRRKFDAQNGPNLEPGTWNLEPGTWNVERFRRAKTVWNMALTDLGGSGGDAGRPARQCRGGWRRCLLARTAAE